MNKLIVRISEGLGNQLFMYANAYALSKKINYKLFVDNISAYKKLKIRTFLLDKFNIDLNYATKDDVQDTFYKYLKYKYLKKIDFFYKKKSFLLEKKTSHKNTYYQNLTKVPLKDKVVLEGNYESELYFQDYKNEIINLFKINSIDENTLFFDPKILNDNNSVSIAVRQNRFSEKKYDQNSKQKSEKFVKDTLSYIFKSMNFIKTKISNPKFFIFSNDIKDLNLVFQNYENCTIINHTKNKIINDFYLSTHCKHFIVGPTTFHWWTAYLSQSNNKICVCPPKSLKFSANENIFPSNWTKI